MGYRIAVLGERDIVAGFAALGLDVYPVDQPQQAVESFRRITREETGVEIIYVTETFASALAEEIDRFRNSASPAIILIPGRGGSLGIGRDALKSAVERAVGADIL